MEPTESGFGQRLAGTAARLILLGLIALMPWAFGGMEPRAGLWGYAAVLAALACWAFSALSRWTEKGGLAPSRPHLLQRSVPSRGACPPFSAGGKPFTVPPAAAALVAAVALGFLQLVPLPESLHRLLCPQGARLSEFLSGNDANRPTPSSLADPGPRPVSWYPASTRRDLAWLVLATMVFLLGARFFRGRDAYLWLCYLLAVNGAALACFGIVQRLRWEGLLFWHVPLTEGGHPFGPFVNKNNAGGFLNLCFAGALGATARAFSHTTSQARPDGVVPPTPTRGLAQRLREVVGALDAPQLTLLALTACIAAGVLATLSRGAFLAMLGAAAVTLITALLLRHRTLHVWLIGAAATGAIALVGWVGLTETVQRQLATLMDLRRLPEEGRLFHWNDGLDAAEDFWLLGSGLGTYRYVYRLYQERFDPRWFYHAENVYLEAAVEGGIAALGLIVAAIALVGVAAWRVGRHPSDQTLAIVGVFAITTQFLHAFFDFGLYLPANALLFALLCGSVCGRATCLQQLGRTRETTDRPPARMTAAALLGGTIMLLMCLWGLLEMRRLPAIEAARKALASVSPDSADASPEALDRLLRTALEHAWDDSETQRRRAEAYIRKYRDSQFQRLKAEAPDGADDAALRRLTDLVQLHYRAHQLARDGDSAGLDRLRADRAVREYLRPAHLHLIAARRYCPLLPQVHLRLAELSFLTGEPLTDALHLKRVKRLAPADPDLLFRSALLHFSAGRDELAYAHWRASLQLTPRHEAAVVQIASQRIGFEQLIDKVLPPSPQLLVRVARRFASEKHSQQRQLLLARAEVLIDQAGLTPDQRHYLWASIHLLRQRWDDAVESYRRALELRPEQFRWRFELATILFQQGALADAHQHARRCARQQPSNRAVQRLLRRINAAR